MRPGFGFTVALATVLSTSSVWAQDDTGANVSAARLPDTESGSITLDGRLLEPIWRGIVPVSGFRQLEPVEGAPASERTVVRVAYDRATLYIGIIAHDARPEAVIGRVLQRDQLAELGFDNRPVFTGDDAVAILLDPFHDHRNAVVFATNPNGAEFDALITDEGREFNIDWRGVWKVAAARTSEGWSAEFAIPFRTLRFPSDGRTWGFNVYRLISRKNEQVLLASWSRSNEGLTRVSRAGHLDGLRDLPRPGHNIELKPYVLAGLTQQEEEDSLPGVLDADPRLEPGLDLKYELRPGLLLDLTLNTDFAQVEADDEQVNLTRFSLFFPEKRDFFLENAGVFEFGTRGFFEPPPFLLFFSRQIGIAEDGEVPVIGGARLTGRVGKQTVGLLDIVTDAAFDLPRENFAVARLKRNIAGNGYLGAMLVDRRSEEGWNTAGGVDASFWPVADLNLQAFLAHTASSADSASGSAYRLGADYQSDRWGVTAQHLYVGPETTADMGFITRSDIRRTSAFTRITTRPPIAGLRRLDSFVVGNHITRTDGVLQDWEAGIALSPLWNSGDNVTLFYTRGFTRLDEAFDLTDDVPVPPGDYETWQVGAFANSSQSRPWVAAVQTMAQGFYDGDLRSLVGSLSVTPNRHVSVFFTYTHNDVSIPTGAFTADVVSLRISYAFSTRAFVNALLQYNSLDNTVSANVRFNFIHRPGSDLFIVFNEQRGTKTNLWDTTDRGAVVKLTYLARI
jgi:hypothetical protein